MSRMASDPLYVSNSELATYKRCRRKWWLAWYRGLKPRRSPYTGARQLGTRVHLALAPAYVPDDQPSQDPRETLEAVLAADRQAAVAELQQVEELTEEGLLAARLSEFDKEADLARAMIEGYVDWLAETGEDEDLEVLATEQAVQLPLSRFQNDHDVRLLGRLDVRVRRRHDGVRLFLDHKTVGAFADAVKRLKQDEQMLTYHVLEALTADEEERTGGALYNMLRKVKRTARAKPPFYAREPVEHSRLELNSFWTRLHGTITDVLAARHRLDAGVNHLAVTYPTPTRDCSWDCDFALVCPMFDDGSRAEEMLAAHYVETDRLERYPELKEIESETSCGPNPMVGSSHSHSRKDQP